MSKRVPCNLIILAVASLFGLGAACSPHATWRSAPPIELRQQGQMGHAVVAKTDLAVGTPSPATSSPREVLVEWLHFRAITPEQFERAAGAVLRGPAGSWWRELLGVGRSSKSGDPPPSPRSSPRGRRATTIPVRPRPACLRPAAPGATCVDLLATVQRDHHHLTLPPAPGRTRARDREPHPARRGRWRWATPGGSRHPGTPGSLREERRPGSSHAHLARLTAVPAIPGHKARRLRCSGPTRLRSGLAPPAREAGAPVITAAREPRARPHPSPPPAPTPRAEARP